MIPNPTSKGKISEAVILLPLAKMGEHVLIPWGALTGPPIRPPRAKPGSRAGPSAARAEALDGTLVGFSQEGLYGGEGCFARVQDAHPALGGVDRVGQQRVQGGVIGFRCA